MTPACNGKTGSGRARAQRPSREGRTTRLWAPPRAVWVDAGRSSGRGYGRRHARRAWGRYVPYFVRSRNGQRCAARTRTPPRSVGVDRGSRGRWRDHARGTGRRDVLRLGGGVGPARRVVCLSRGYGPAPRLRRRSRSRRLRTGFGRFVAQITRGPTRGSSECKLGNMS